MTAALKIWFYGLSERERWLVGIAGALAAIVLLVFGLILPGIGAIESAEEAHDAAVERRGRIEAMVANAGTSRPSGTAASAADIDLVITQSAAENGFDLLKAAGNVPGEISFRIDSARAPALFGWLSALEAQGVEASTLTLRGNAAGAVTVEAKLRRVRP
jgi:general secretion pathway protein M